MHRIRHAESGVKAQRAAADSVRAGSFGLDRCCEELSAITALARQDDVPFELSEHVEGIYQRALARYGPADGELLPVAMLEEQAGVQLRARARPSGQPHRGE
jgi:hypothetical protein